MYLTRLLLLSRNVKTETQKAEAIMMVLIEVKEELVGCNQWKRRQEGREEIHQGRRAI